MNFRFADSNRRDPRVLSQCSHFRSPWDMRIQFLLRDIILLLAFLSAVSASGEDPGPLRLEKEIPLPEVEGRIDHFSADETGQRLFIAALENGSVEIVDVRRGERTAEIKGLKEPQGVYYDGKTGRLFVATGGDGKLRIYDGKTLASQHTLELGGDADNVRLTDRPEIFGWATETVESAS